MLRSRDAYEGLIRNPSSAIFAAGASASPSVLRPYFCTAASNAATSPGTPLASAPIWLSDSPALPLRMNMSRVAPAGARSRPSIATISPFARRMSIKHPPPIPELQASTTPRVRPTATAASIALPPLFSASRPAWVARGWTDATMPRWAGAGSAARAAESITVEKRSATIVKTPSEQRLRPG